MAVVVFVFDVDADMLDNQVLPGLRQYGLADHGLELRRCSNRNAMLREIAHEPGPSLALIDLQLDQRREDNYSGHRIIETIRHHPELSGRCRPMALTVLARRDVHSLVADHGAYAMVCRGEIDNESEFDLAGMLLQQAQRPADGPTAEVECHVIPGEHALAKPYDNDTDEQLEVEEREIVRKFFDLNHLDDRRWAMLRYAAIDMDWASAEELIEEEFGGMSGRTPRDVFREKLKLQYRGDLGNPVGYAAREIFQALPHRRATPTLESSMLELPRLAPLARMGQEHAETLKRKGYLDDPAWETLKAVLWAREDSGSLMTWPKTNLGHSKQLGHIRHRLYRLLPKGIGVREENAILQRLQKELVRGAHNIYDTAAADE